MDSTIEIDPPLARTAHALAHLARRPVDNAFLRTQLAASDAALDAFEAALAHPLAEVDEPAHRAYLAALVLTCTLAALPGDLTSCQRTTARMLDLFEHFASPEDRAMRERLTSFRSARDREPSGDYATFTRPGR